MCRLSSCRGVILTLRVFGFSRKDALMGDIRVPQKYEVRREAIIIFFYVIITIFIFVIFRKAKPELKQGTKSELLFGIAWFSFYFALAMISNQFQISVVNEATNWLLLVLLPLLITARIRKEKIIVTLREIGVRLPEQKTGWKILLVCLIYTGIIFFVFSLSEETSMADLNILKILRNFPVFLLLMMVTAGFTEEFFFRGILQRCLTNTLKQPYLAIFITSILFGLYHFPFAYYLWDDVSGNVIDVFQIIMTEQAVAGFAFGLLYEKSNKNLWCSVLLHSLSNAVIMSIGF